jgi:ATP:ADP antiporter, AAA family
MGLRASSAFGASKPPCPSQTLRCEVRAAEILRVVAATFSLTRAAPPLQLSCLVPEIPPRSSRFERLLRVFSDVKPGEGPRAMLMLGCGFLIMSAFYVMKTAREGLILTGGTFGLRGEELKAYATGAMAVLLIGIVPAYDALTEHARRIRLVNISYAIVLMSLLGFWVLGRAGVPLGLAYFLWFGLFSCFLVAQFWAYANDIYDEDQGARLFAVIAAGGSLGAIVGPRIARHADTFSLMLVAAGLIVGSIVLFNVIEHLLPARKQRTAELGGPGGFSLVLGDRGLLMVAGMLIIANLVNSTGEFILSNAVRVHAMDTIPATAHPELTGAVREAVITEERRELIKLFYSDFFSYVNALSFLIQAFVVSRVIKKIGVRHSLLVLPVVAFGAYGAIAMFGGLWLVRNAKLMENAIDYSLQNTVRQSLFLRTDRVVKYKAKTTIDTFFVRVGDALSAVVVGVGLHSLGLTARQLALVNLVLIIVWVAIALRILQHNFAKHVPVGAGSSMSWHRLASRHASRAQ